MGFSYLFHLSVRKSKGFYRFQVFKRVQATRSAVKTEIFGRRNYGTWMRKIWQTFSESSSPARLLNLHFVYLIHNFVDYYKRRPHALPSDTDREGSEFHGRVTFVDAVADSSLAEHSNSEKCRCFLRNKVAVLKKRWKLKSLKGLKYFSAVFIAWHVYICNRYFRLISFFYFFFLLVNQDKICRESVFSQQRNYFRL